MTIHGFTKRDVMEHLSDAIADNSDIEGQAEHLINALQLETLPEKPEPGTWHVVTDEGAYANQSAYVGGYGNLLIFADNGDYDNLAADMLWPALTPARVVSEAEWEELYEKAEAQADAIDLLRQARDNWAELAHKAERETKAVARRKMGTKAEVTADQVDLAVRSGIATSKRDMLDRFTLEDRITSAVMELLEASK